MSSKIKMQLRTNRKLKTTEFDDLGFEEKPPKAHKKPKPKIPAEKDHSLDEVRHIRNNSIFYFYYYLQFSNYSKEKEIKHSLRAQVNHILYINYLLFIIQPSNVQGKYKKMNSGKYLYKVSAEKKNQITKKVNVRKNNI